MCLQCAKKSIGRGFHGKRNASDVCCRVVVADDLLLAGRSRISCAQYDITVVLRTRRHGSGWRTSLRHCVELFVDCEGLSVPIENVAQGVIFKMLCQAKRGQNHGI